MSCDSEEDLKHHRKLFMTMIWYGSSICQDGHRGDVRTQAGVMHYRRELECVI